MNRGLRTFAIVFGIGSLFFAGGYFLSRPTWRTATAAEIRAQFDPDLLVTPKEIPDAQARYRRFAAIVDRIELNDLVDLASERPGTDILATDAAHLKALDALLREGPIQAPPGTSPRPQNEKFTILVRQLTQAAPVEAFEGRPDSSVWLLLLAIRIHHRLGEHPGTMSDFLSGAARVSLLVQGVDRSVARLPQEGLIELADHLPPARAHDAALLNALRDEIRTSFIPYLVHPMDGGTWDDRGDLRIRGNYDALETARDLNRALVPWRLNAARPRSEQDLSGDAYLHALERSLPLMNRSGRSEIARRFSEWRYSWEMARLPNSFGRWLLLGATNGAFQGFADTSYRTRALWEGMRTLIALRRYRLAKGTSAPSLQSLVDAGFLPKLPFDHLGTGPLMYDPTRSVLWSIGTDGHDDGGTALPGVMGQNDIVWQTP